MLLPGILAWTVMAAPPASPATPVSATAGVRHVIILSGADDPAAGKAQFAAAQARLATWAPVLAEGALKPMLVASADVPGLKPGFHVVLVGTCTDPDLASGLAIARAVEPGAYSRPLVEPVPAPVAALGCPAVRPGWRLGEAVVARVGKRKVRAQRVDATEDPTGVDRDWQVVATLVDESGRSLADERVSREQAGEEFGMGCQAAVAAGSRGITLTLTQCTRPRGCPVPATLDVVVRLGAGENQVTRESRITRRHEPPCAGE